jgi:hypothetical protein
LGVPRQTLHAWLAKYEAGGLEGLGDAFIRIYPEKINSFGIA